MSHRPYLSLALVLMPCLFASMMSPAQEDANYGEAFEARRSELVEAYAESNARNVFNDLLRLERGMTIEDRAIGRELDQIINREDTADFAVPALLWLHYKYAGYPGVSQDILDDIKQALLGFKFWPDEPGEDDMIAYTENHYILFASGAFLAGQRWPEAVFTNSGWTGAEQMARHRPRILHWLNLRFKTGFWEWMSNIYYAHTATALVALAELCDDEEIAQRAKMVLDLLCLDIALNSYDGVLGSPKGRTEARHMRFADTSHTTEISWLLFGEGARNDAGNAAALLALSERYRMPEVIYRIYADELPARLNRQRVSIDVGDGPQYGLTYDNLEDGMLWLNMNAFGHPLTANLFIDMMDAYHWWGNASFALFAPFQETLVSLREAGLLPGFAANMQADLGRSLLSGVNIYTYRTPDFMLSSAPDYRPGSGGAQQQIWQATLGRDAVCFTTHPGALTAGRPGYWAGNGWMPRVMQWENVLIAIYNARDKPGLYLPETPGFTHAWLPRDAFDEFIEQDGWLFAREGEGYLALRSQNPYVWQSEPGENQDREIIVDGRQNVYVCELGNPITHGSFAQFMEVVAAAPLRFDGLSVSYTSPSQGALEYAWASEYDDDQSDYVAPAPFPRFDNPYVKADFPSETLFVEHEDDTLWLDWETAARATDFTPPEPMPVGVGSGLALVLSGVVLVAYVKLRV